MPDNGPGRKETPMSNETIHAPMACTVVEVPVAAGQTVRAGQTLVVIEAMKMEHEIRAEADAQVL
ncbi:MAG: acetyl-CoA carboxylase biotin carboxyl carrier protein subunit, partial [Pseudomonadota bacterium]